MSLLSGAPTQAHCPGLLEALEPLRQSLGAVRASAPEFETGPSAAAIDRYVRMRDGRSYQEKDVPMTTKGNEGQSALVPVANIILLGSRSRIGR